MVGAPGRVLVYGASGHGKVVVDVALAAGWTVLGFGDGDAEKRGRTVLGVPVVALGEDEAVTFCREQDARFIVAIGSNLVRRQVFERFVAGGVEPAVVVHPRAVVAATARLGVGTVVMAGAVINPDARVGRDVIVNTGAVIEHDNVVGDHAHLSPGVKMGGTVRVGEGTHVGIGAVVRNNIEIGAWSLVGAGAVVVSPIGDRVAAWGCPAKVRRKHTP